MKSFKFTKAFISMCFHILDVDTHPSHYVRRDIGVVTSFRKVCVAITFMLREVEFDLQILKGVLVWNIPRFGI